MGSPTEETTTIPLVVAVKRQWQRVAPYWRLVEPSLIAFIWLFWGAQHFISATVASKQVPAYLPLREEIFALSGMVEILMGLAMWTRLRRPSLLLQMILLVAFLPAVAHLLVDDAAIESLFAGWSHASGRIFLIVHNAVLFMWAYRLYTHGRAQREPVSKPDAPRRTAPPAQRNIVLVSTIMLLANLAGFTIIAISPWYRTTLDMWGIASLAGGALVGFLFGVPRIKTAEAARAEGSSGPGAGKITYRPNANIEVLSDWLTKIIVGVGLVEFHQIGPILDNLTRPLAMGLQESGLRPTSLEEGVMFAKGVVVYFALAGIIQGYLLTRMFLARAFRIDSI